MRFKNMPYYYNTNLKKFTRDVFFKKNTDIKNGVSNS